MNGPAYRGPAIAASSPHSIRIYTADNDSRLITTIRAADHGSPDDLLRAYGWVRRGPWSRSDDMPDGVTVAPIDWTADPAIERLARDQEIGRARRAAVGPCPCECNSGGFCGGCGHAGCGGRR